MKHPIRVTCVALAACALAAFSPIGAHAEEPIAASAPTDSAETTEPAEAAEPASADSHAAPAKEAAMEHEIAKPATISREAWGSDPDPIPEERRHTPQYITIHHAGVLWKSGDDPMKKVKALQSWGKSDKKWPDLPYHFLIAPDGRIFEGRPVEYEPETNTEYTVAGHIGVELMGNFSAQRISREQLESVTHLVAWLQQQYHIPAEFIRGHRDVAETECPGKDFYRYIGDQVIHGWVAEIAAGNEPKIEPLLELPDGPTEEIPKE